MALASISFSILSSPPLLIFSSSQRHGLVSILRGEKENGNVPVVIPKWSIAARLAKLRTGLIIYLTAMLIAERQSPPPSCACYRDLLPSKCRHSKIMGFIRFLQSDDVDWFISGLVQILSNKPQKSPHLEAILIQEIESVFEEIPPPNRGQ